MFNTFVFNGLGFDYLSLFHYSFDDRPQVQGVQNSYPALTGFIESKPMMVDSSTL